MKSLGYPSMDSLSSCLEPIMMHPTLVTTSFERKCGWHFGRMDTPLLVKSPSVFPSVAWTFPQGGTSAGVGIAYPHGMENSECYSVIILSLCEAVKDHLDSSI